MDSGYMKQKRARILSAEDGTIFAISDFADIADSATVRQSLNRLVLNEFVEVNPDAVAKTLARTFHWTIASYGNAARYLSGLSNQRPAIWSYISTGPYRIYKWNSIRIEVKHSTNKEFIR